MDHHQTLKIVFIILVSASCVTSLSCIDDKGSPVAWFSMLKYPKGCAYLYADSRNATLEVSEFDCSSPTEGALAHTLLQVYQASDLPGLLFYNDQPPPSKFIDNATQYGHSKGVAAWTADNGFWIVHSFPEFPPRLESGYTGVDESQQVYGQSVLCVSTDATGMDVVGQQLQYNFAQIYEVNAPSYTPPTLMATAEGQHVTEPEASMRELVAIDKTTFTSFSKSGEWGKRLYADLVAPVLKSDLLVETWIRGSKIPSECPSDGYSVKNVQQLQFPGQLFKETQDHSKWAITLHHSIVCIGGINQMTSQNKRGGGTLCLPNKDLWTSFNDAVYAVEPCE